MNKKILMTCGYSPGLRKAWEKFGFIVFDCITDSFSSEYDDIFQEVKRKVNDEGISHIFSYDFSPNLAKIGMMLHLTYISWVWDSPHLSLWAKEARYDSNRIFLFDYEQFLVQLERGLDNVYYLPLASDFAFFSEVINQSNDAQKNKFRNDVSFVGNLYTDKNHSLFDQISYLPPYTKGYLEALICMQKDVWGANIIKNGIPDRVWNDIKRYVKWDLGERYEKGVYEQNFMYLLQTKIAQVERLDMCNELAERFDFSLYTNCNTDYNTKINNKGYAAYLRDMPLIFSESKINIHITMRAIESGIPLRVMDVLACGGFLLTNYQSEIAEYFDDGKELVVYFNQEDMLEKVEYYLDHEKERLEIAANGRNKVKHLFSFDAQIKKMTEALESEHRI